MTSGRQGGCILKGKPENIGYMRKKNLNKRDDKYMNKNVICETSH